MKYSNGLIIVVVILFVTGCQLKYKTTSENIVGTWYIDEIKYDTINVRRYLVGNLLRFKENNELKIPDSNYSVYENPPKWSFELVKDKTFLIMNSDNFVFNGKFNIHFFYDKERGFNGVELKRDSVYIKAFKSNSENFISYFE